MRGCLGTWAEPPVRRAALLSCELEQVVSEEDGHLVVVQQLAALGVFAVAAVEDVERAVVLGALQVLGVVLHLHLHRVAVVILATLELLVAVLAFEALQGPFFSGGPVFLAVQQDHGLVGPLEALDEVLRTELEGVHALHRVLEGQEHIGCLLMSTTSSQARLRARLLQRGPSPVEPARGSSPGF